MTEQAAVTATRAERKLVTALFCDIAGSTALGERLDPEAWQTVQAAYFGAMRSIIEQFGGAVEKYQGDGVVVVFGIPRAREDDAERAVRCGLAMQDGIRDLNETLRLRFGLELSVRIGIETGEAVVSKGADALATGRVMTSAARLEQGAGAGEVIVGRDAMLLTRDVIEYGDGRHLDAKGKGTLEAWPARGVAVERRRPRAKLLGRARELEQLAAAVDLARLEGAPRAVAVIGEPGIGKSRLVEEFLARTAADAAVFAGACRAYGEETPWSPLPTILRAEAGIAADDPELRVRSKLRACLERRHAADEAPLIEAQLAPLLGAARTSSASRAELLWAIRRYLEALALEQPTVLVLDDLHWASQPLFGLLLDLLDTVGLVPLVLVCVGRPELRERLVDPLAGGRLTLLELESLTEADARELLEALSDRPLGDGGLNDTIVARAGGNPLFIEELVGLATDETLSHAAVPHSLRALIAARLDLLPDEAKRAVQTAAVVGTVFWDAALAELLESSSEFVWSSLRELEARGLVRRERTSAFAGTRQFRYHHALIRDVAYESLPKRDRSLLHRRAAGWLDARAESRSEFVVAIAEHRDRAFALAAEIAPAARPDLEDGRATVAALRRAAEWATHSAALPEAVRLLRRAVTAAAAIGELEDITRAQLALALVRAGEPAEGVHVAAAAVATSASTEAVAFASLALAEEARNRGDAEASRQHAQRVIDIASSRELAALEAEAHHLLVWLDFWAGHVRDALRHAARSTALALNAGDLAQAARFLAFEASGAIWLGNAATVEEKAERALAMAREAASVASIGWVHSHCLAYLRRLQGRLDEAVEHGREAARIFRNLGDRFAAASVSAWGIADPLIDAGRLDEAWETLDDALSMLEPGTSAAEGLLRVRRARVLLIRGRLEEAEAELDAFAPTKGYGQDDAAALRAEIRAAQGRDADAERLWRDALAQVPDEHRLDRAELQLPYATYLARRGRRREAEQLLRSVHALVDGSGWSLLERELRSVESLLVARHNPPT